MDNLADFGYKLRILRQTRGLSQAALGRKCNISQKVISHYENNYRMPTVETLSVIARVLETPIGDLCNEPAKPPTDDIELKKYSIWCIAERLELLDEAERAEVLAHINRMITENSGRRQGDAT